VLQREEHKGGAAITEKLSLSTPSSSPAMLTWTDDTHVKGDWFPLHRCCGVPNSGAAPECTEPPVSTLLLSAVHPVTPYTRTQPSTAIRELCGTLSARAG
jgi:hypothetical protein